MIDQSLLAECRDLALTIAPELERRPVYVVDCLIFAGLPNPPGCLGYANHGIVPDFDRRERIEGWDGAGPIIALSEDLLREEYGSDFELGIKKTLVHEVGHVTPAFPEIPNPNWEYTLGIEDTPEFRAALREKAVRAMQEAPEVGSSLDPHGIKFVRRTCHLWARARFAGVTLPLDYLFGGSCWWMSQGAHYITALLPELYEMRSSTFDEIEAEEPPKSFTELYRHNLEFYQTFQGESK